MLNIFNTSHIKEQMEYLKKYHCDLEITGTKYLRISDPKTGEIKEKGSVFY